MSTGCDCHRLLRGDVVRRAHDRPFLRHGAALVVVAGWLIETGQAHVEDLDDLAVGRQQQVVRLDVAMDQAALVGVLQAQRRLPDELARLRHRQRAVLLDQPGQVGRSFDVLHDEQVRAADLVGVEGADDVRV